MVLKFSQNALDVGTPHTNVEQIELTPLWITIDKVSKVKKQKITFETDDDGFKKAKELYKPDLLFMHYDIKVGNVFYKVVEYEREGINYFVMYNGPAYLCNDDGQTMEKI